MQEDVQHVDRFLRMDDVEVTFGIFIYYFVQHPSYLLRCTLPSSTYIKSLISFDSSFHKVFGHLSGSRSFDSPKGPLARKQTSLPITFNDVKLISTFTVTPVDYLKKRGLVVLVIVVRFMVDQNPFLLETLARVNNNTFPFQQHLKATCDLLPPLAHACILPFEQFIGQQMIQLQDSILECLHHHTLSSMFSNETSKTHHAQFLSCFGLRVSIWLTTQLV